MGYSETNSWTLASEKVPELQSDDFIIVTVQAYNEKAPSDITTEVEKAQYLYNGEFTGSAWSDAVTLIKE